MPEFTLNVFFQNNDYVKRLEQERDLAQEQSEAMRVRLRRLELECTNEKHVNMELIDKLRDHGIRYRPSADMRKWK